MLLKFIPPDQQVLQVSEWTCVIRWQSIHHNVPVPFLYLQPPQVLWLVISLSSSWKIGSFWHKTFCNRMMSQRKHGSLESALHSIATKRRIHILNKSCPLMKHHRFLSRQLTLVCTHFRTHIRSDSWRLICAILIHLTHTHSYICSFDYLNCLLFFTILFF